MNVPSNVMKVRQERALELEMFAQLLPLKRHLLSEQLQILVKVHNGSIRETESKGRANFVN